MHLNRQILYTFVACVLLNVSNGQYCSIPRCGSSHTMCRYPNPGPSASCARVIQVGLTSTQKQNILAIHNHARRKASSGITKRKKRSAAWDNFELDYENYKYKYQSYLNKYNQYQQSKNNYYQQQQYYQNQYADFQNQYQNYYNSYQNYYQQYPYGGIYQQQGQSQGYHSSGPIPDLQWDSELESVAQQWANQCSYGHDSCRDVARFRVGQNIGIFTNKGSAEHIAYAWYRESQAFGGRAPQFFSSLDMNGQQTGHYTQMIWRGTGYLGCGAVKYASGSDTNVYLVCNYGPAGNVYGQYIS